MATARALQKLVGGSGATTEQIRDARGRFEVTDGIRRLAEEIGKSHVFILDHLSMLNESGHVQEWLESPDAKYLFWVLT